MFRTKAKTIFFHVGSIKTGSTGLQKFCYENRQALIEKDLDYIQLEPARLDLPRWANADYLLKSSVDSAELSKKLARSPTSRILISDEALMPRPHIWQSSVFKKFRRVVIVYLRNSVDLVASWASENSLPYNFSQSEHASGRGVVSIEEGLRVWSFNYRRMLQQFFDAIKHDKDLEVVVRPFPPKGGEGGLERDFLDALRFETEDVDQLVNRATGEKVNVGHSRKYCDISYHLSTFVQEYDLSHLYGSLMVDEINTLTESGDGRRVIDTLSNVQMHLIRDRLFSAGQALQERFHGLDFITSLPETFLVDREPYRPVDIKELKYLFLDYVVRKQIK